MQGENIELRPVTFKDAEILFNWRKDFYTQKNSFSENDIIWEEHELWLKRKLQDPNCFMFICMLQGSAIGKLQIDVVDRIGNIGFVVAPEARRKGYGAKIIGLAAKAVQKEVDILIGLVKSNNIASQKCFLKNDYTCFTGGDTHVYIKSI